MNLSSGLRITSKGKVRVLHYTYKGSINGHEALYRLPSESCNLNPTRRAPPLSSLQWYPPTSQGTEGAKAHSAKAPEWVKPIQTAGTRVDFSNIDRDKAEIRCVYHLGNKRCASEEKQSLGAIILLLLDRSVGFGDLHNLKEKVRLLTR